MVELCKAKGLHARVADFLSLGVSPASFDAVYALNRAWGNGSAPHAQGGRVRAYGALVKGPWLATELSEDRDAQPTAMSLTYRI